jgi:hypothetical protein
VSNSRQAHRPGFGQNLHSRRHVHTVAEQIAVAHRRFANVQADAKANPAFLRNLLVHGGDPLLDAERTLQRFHSAWELREDAVAGRVRDPPAMLLDKSVGYFAV